MTQINETNSGKRDATTDNMEFKEFLEFIF